jgi:hypothetical protein
MRRLSNLLKFCFDLPIFFAINLISKCQAAGGMVREAWSGRRHAARLCDLDIVLADGLDIGLGGVV